MGLRLQDSLGNNRVELGLAKIEVNARETKYPQQAVLDRQNHQYPSCVEFWGV